MCQSANQTLGERTMPFKPSWQAATEVALKRPLCSGKVETKAKAKLRTAVHASDESSTKGANKKKIHENW